MATGLLEERNETKPERSRKRQPSLQKHVFFSALMYCTVQYRRRPYTYKSINFFSLQFMWSLKTRSFWAMAYWETSALSTVLPLQLFSLRSLFHRKDVSPSHWLSSETLQADLQVGTNTNPALRCPLWICVLPICETWLNR